jgi:hypothetical protein
MGWSKNGTDSIDYIPGQDTGTLTSDLTLIAVWQEKEITSAGTRTATIDFPK